MTAPKYEMPLGCNVTERNDSSSVRAKDIFDILIVSIHQTLPIHRKVTEEDSFSM